MVKFWIVNVKERRLEVYRRPTQGVYALSMILTDQDTVELVQKSGALTQVADLLTDL